MKIFPKFDITKLKNKTMATYSNQGLQNLVHVLFHEVEIMKSITSKIKINTYFARRNKSSCYILWTFHFRIIKKTSQRNLYDSTIPLKL